MRLHDRPDAIPDDIRINMDSNPDKMKHFWAFAVWNYRDKQGADTRNHSGFPLRGAAGHGAQFGWDDPTNYDITITKRGQKLDTEYTVQPSPVKSRAGRSCERHGEPFKVRPYFAFSQSRHSF